MKTLHSFRLARTFDTGIELLVENRHLLTVFVLEPQLFRVVLRKDGKFRLGRSWSVAPKPEGTAAPADVAWEGRSRLDLSGFSCPSFTLDDHGEAGLTLSTSDLRLTITEPLTFVWEARQADGRFLVFAEDRPTGAYMLDVKSHAHAHYLNRRKGEKVYGLGEKSGDLERSGRRYEMRNLDAMGYDARSTDPLYKHIPVTITRTPDAGTFSVFYDNLAGCWFDLGNELDNYHKPYRTYRAEDGDLDYYMRWSPSVLDAVKHHVRLTGGTAFPPLWSLGYSGSTMHYTDAPNAQEQLEGFVRLVDEHDIPCDSFQLSSGYSSIGAKRYVFTWNSAKVPDPAGLAATFAGAGLHLAANIKPCLLQDHPMYQDVAARDLFIKDSESDVPSRSVFWDDEGSNLDFTNPATIAWWQGNIADKLLRYGINSTWNDNNEFEVWDNYARCHGFGEEIDVGLMRPLLPVLMTRASHEVQVAHQPDTRPYLISRSGAPGLQRYAQTWTGDNYTAWETIRYNIRMGLGMSLSGLYNVGHDVGGFAGPKPDPELFVRWVQNGIFHPRFTIHSWNDDHTVNEPWMYPNVTPLIREAIKFRYRLLPYLYTALHQAVTADEPMLRPTFLDHEHDPRTFEECDEFLIGRDLLVANVVDPGVTERTVYLPQNDTGWWDFWAGSWHAGGTTITLPVTLASMPLFVRGGAVLPLADDLNRAQAARDTSRTYALFPAPGTATGVSLEYGDDGFAVDALDGNHALVRLALTSTASEIRLDVSRSGRHDPAWADASFVLPSGETRPLILNGEPIASGVARPVPRA